MEKYEELERLQRLKESGAINENEYNIEKDRILNDTTNKKKKKKIKWWQAIIIVVVGTALLMWVSTTLYNIDRNKRFEENMKKITGTTDPSDYGLPDNYKIPTQEEIDDLFEKAKEQSGNY